MLLYTVNYLEKVFCHLNSINNSILFLCWILTSCFSSPPHPSGASAATPRAASQPPTTSGSWLEKTKSPTTSYLCMSTLTKARSSSPRLPPPPQPLQPSPRKQRSKAPGRETHSLLWFLLRTVRGPAAEVLREDRQCKDNTGGESQG